MNNSEFTKAYFKSDFPVCMAPMVGLTHYVFRKVVRDYLPQNANTIWPTEMLNSRRIPNEILGQTSETYVPSDEVGLVPQLLGNELEPIGESLKKLNEHWPLAGVDINMGCPVQKALKHNYGVSLMGDADYAAQVVKYTVQASNALPYNLPVSVKLRSVDSDGESDPVRLIAFMQKLQAAGASWLTLHPRLPEMKRRGRADWSQLKIIKKHLSIPLIGNGDIQTSQDVFRMLEETDVNKVMIGRSLTAKPWLMWQVGKKLGLENPEGKESDMAPATPEEEGHEYGKMLLKFIDLSHQIYVKQLGQSENLILRKIQFFVKTGHVWLEFGHELMSQVNRSKSFEELTERVTNFFRSEQVMNAYTDLRQ